MTTPEIEIPETYEDLCKYKGPGPLVTTAQFNKFITNFHKGIKQSFTSQNRHKFCVDTFSFIRAKKGTLKQHKNVKQYKEVFGLERADQDYWKRFEKRFLSKNKEEYKKKGILKGGRIRLPWVNRGGCKIPEFDDRTILNQSESSSEMGGDGDGEEQEDGESGESSPLKSGSRSKSPIDIFQRSKERALASSLTRSGGVETRVSNVNSILSVLGASGLQKDSIENEAAVAGSASFLGSEKEADQPTPLLNLNELAGGQSGFFQKPKPLKKAARKLNQTSGIGLNKPNQSIELKTLNSIFGQSSQFRNSVNHSQMFSGSRTQQSSSNQQDPSQNVETESQMSFSTPGGLNQPFERLKMNHTDSHPKTIGNKQKISLFPAEEVETADIDLPELNIPKMIQSEILKTRKKRQMEDELSGAKDVSILPNHYQFFNEPKKPVQKLDLGETEDLEVDEGFTNQGNFLDLVPSPKKPLNHADQEFRVKNANFGLGEFQGEENQQKRSPRRQRVLEITRRKKMIDEVKILHLPILSEYKPWTQKTPQNEAYSSPAKTSNINTTINTTQINLKKRGIGQLHNSINEDIQDLSRPIKHLKSHQRPPKPEYISIGCQKTEPVVNIEKRDIALSPIKFTQIRPQKLQRVDLSTEKLPRGQRSHIRRFGQKVKNSAENAKISDVEIIGESRGHEIDQIWDKLESLENIKLEMNDTKQALVGVFGQLRSISEKVDGIYHEVKDFLVTQKKVSKKENKKSQKKEEFKEPKIQDSGRQFGGGSIKYQRSETALTDTKHQRSTTTANRRRRPIFQKSSKRVKFQFFYQFS